MHIERALTIQANTIGIVHPDHGRARNTYGTILEALGRHTEALAAYQTAGDIIALRNGPDHPDIAMVLSNMGHCYFELNDDKAINKAIELYRRAIGLLNSKGSRDLMLASVSHNLGYCYVRKRDGHNAKPCFELAAEIRRRILSDIHNDVAVSLGNLAFVEERLENPERAATLYREVECIYSDLGLPKNRDHLGFLQNYVFFLTRTGRTHEASVVQARLDSLWPDESDPASGG